MRSATRAERPVDSPLPVRWLVSGAVTFRSLPYVRIGFDTVTAQLTSASGLPQIIQQAQRERQVRADLSLEYDLRNNAVLGTEALCQHCRPAGSPTPSRLSDVCLMSLTASDDFGNRRLPTRTRRLVVRAGRCKGVCANIVDTDALQVMLRFPAKGDNGCVG